MAEGHVELYPKDQAYRCQSWSWRVHSFVMLWQAVVVIRSDWTFRPCDRHACHLKCW